VRDVKSADFGKCKPKSAISLCHNYTARRSTP
jgi:hypothetical protein